MQAIVDPNYYKRTERISPGLVGSVGDVLASVRLKQSTPDMAMRYAPEFYGKKEPRGGSNVQDGFSYSYTTGGGPAQTLSASLVEPRKRAHGFAYQDLRATDRRMEPIVGSTGRYSWNNKIATVIEAQHTGDLFYPLPSAFNPTSMTRGSQYPTITDVIGPDNSSLSSIGIQPDKPKSVLPGVSSVVDKKPGFMCTKAGPQTVEQIHAAMQSVVYPSVPRDPPRSGGGGIATGTNTPAANAAPAGGWFT